MIDNTKVNNLQDKLLQAMDIVNARALESISYDKTIVCTIQSDKDKAEGKYEVSDGSMTFTAYSMDTSLSTGNTVYVTIPQNNFENQKMIVGRKTSETEKPFNFVTPFDQFFSMTDNLLESQQLEGKLVANDKSVFIEDDKNTLIVNNKDAQILKLGSTIDTSDIDLLKYTRLAIKADFKSLIKNAVKGDYGLLVLLKTIKPGIIGQSKEEANYPFLFNNSNMYGNPYNFETYYKQELVLDIESQDIGQVTSIEIYFYQGNNFYDINDSLLLSTYTEEENSEKIAPNLFVKNIELHFGYDISMFTKDYVEIYTPNSYTYSHSNQIGENNIENNKKTIKLRWVHIDENGVPVDMKQDNKENKDEDKNYTINWYKYVVGAPSADPYGGIYWEKINEASKLFEYNFSPNIDKQQEKIKVIVLYNQNTPYRSNEIIFENEENLPPSQEAYHILNALTIECDDKTNGNYRIYGQDNSIKDTGLANQVRTMTAYFDINGDGIIDSKTESIADIRNLTWIFPPSDKSMIELLNGGGYEKKELIPFISENYFIQNGETYEQLKKGLDIDVNENYFIKLDNEKYAEVDKSIFYIRGECFVHEYTKADSSPDTEVYDAEQIYYIYNEEKKQYELVKNSKSEEIDTYYILDYYKTTSEMDYEEGRDYYIENKNLTKISGKIPQYKIASNYSPDKSNNTITCQYYLNGRMYTTEKEFTFGPSGTMGTDQTLVIDFAGDKNSVISNDTSVTFKVQLYDNQNVEQDIPDESVTWAWYYGDSSSTIITKGNDELTLEIKSDDSSWGTQLKILQATVGGLTTYFPIPVCEPGYSYITGATQVIYQSNGEPYYNKNEYQLYKTNGNIQEGVTWRIVYQTKDRGILDLNSLPNSDKDKAIIKYMPCLSNETSGYLQPIMVYTKDVGIYGIQAIKNDDNTVVWTQPILVLQNKWPNGVVNAWDGNSLVLNEKNSTILSAAISAGKKNDDDNTFSGVMIGDWKGQDVEGSITEQTGVYGFHHGAMSYAFKEDGTGFIGKDGVGRIEFDGNTATIKSSDYKEPSSETSGEGMCIDFNGGDGNNPFIKMYGGGGKIVLDTAPTDYRYPFEIGDNFKSTWDGTIIANAGDIGGWQLEQYSPEYPLDKELVAGNPNPPKGGRFIASVQAPEGSYWQHITLDPLSNTISGGKFKASILESPDNSAIKLGGVIEVYDAERKITMPDYHTRKEDDESLGEKEEINYDVNAEGYINTSDGKQKAKGLKGGYLGFMPANFGGNENKEKGDYEDNTGTTDTAIRAGIGIKYDCGGTVKATSQNAGMSFGSYYLSLQEAKTVLRGREARLVLQETEERGPSKTDEEGKVTPGEVLSKPHAGLAYGDSYMDIHSDDCIYIHAESNIEVGADYNVALLGKTACVGALTTVTDAGSENGTYYNPCPINLYGKVSIGVAPPDKEIIVREGDSSTTITNGDEKYKENYISKAKADTTIYGSLIVGKEVIIKKEEEDIDITSEFFNTTLYGTLTVNNGLTTLNQGLMVDNGLTWLNKGLTVVGPGTTADEEGKPVYNPALTVSKGLTYLSDGLAVEDGLTVYNDSTTLYGKLVVGNSKQETNPSTTLYGTLEVGGLTTLNGGLTVNGGTVDFSNADDQKGIKAVFA